MKHIYTNHLFTFEATNNFQILLVMQTNMTAVNDQIPFRQFDNKLHFTVHHHVTMNLHTCYVAQISYIEVCRLAST